VRIHHALLAAAFGLMAATGPAHAASMSIGTDWIATAENTGSYGPMLLRPYTWNGENPTILLPTKMGHVVILPGVQSQNGPVVMHDFTFHSKDSGKPSEIFNVGTNPFGLQSEWRDVVRAEGSVSPGNSDARVAFVRE